MVRNTFLSLLMLLSSSVCATAVEYEYGIDVSHWQGAIDWTQVRNDGISFAIMKASQGVDYTDPTFYTNIFSSRAAGITAGVYHFAEPGENDPIAEADHFVSVAGNYMSLGYIRPVLDLESGQFDLDRTALSAWVHAFMGEVKAQTGVEPLIYCNYTFAANYLDESVSKYDLWFARFTDDPTTPPTELGVFDEWAIWQYSSNTTVAGISGRVDGDVCLDITEYMVQPPNQIPVALDDSYRVHVGDSLSVSSTSGVLANDSDGDGDFLTAIKTSQPENGNIFFKTNGSFNYAPNSSYRGTDTFTYQASDGDDLSNEATVSITVYNNAPTVTGDAYELQEGSSLTISEALGVLANDVDIDEDTFEAYLAGDVEHGELTLGTDGSFEYCPITGFSGTDQFTYYATDGWDASETVTVTFNVLAADIPGDANRDGKVDGSDVTILAGNWQTLTGATWDMGDFNGDGKVDGSDVTILAGNWQQGADTAASAVPEPSSGWLILMGLSALLYFDRFSKRYRSVSKIL